MKAEAGVLDPDELQERRGDGPIGRKVLVFQETASTNDLLLRIGASPEPEGLVIFAESQTAGRGRFRRPWHSAPGLGLWFSVLLRPAPALLDPGLLTPWAAVSLHEAVKQSCGCALRIKPPNDLLGRRGKVIGILIEARSGSRPYAVLGVGMNIRHRPADFPPEVRDLASSLEMETGVAVDRAKVAAAALQSLNAGLSALAADSAALLERYNRLASTSVLPSPDLC